jgi:hypothetical protein
MSAVNLIITDLCVFEVKEGGGLVLVELHPGITVDDVRAKTGAPFEVRLKSRCEPTGAPLFALNLGTFRFLRPIGADFERTAVRGMVLGSVPLPKPITLKRAKARESNLSGLLDRPLAAG